MGKIIISNIGNRNPHFKNREISINEFKILTQTYQNEFETYKKHFSLQIIQNHNFLNKIPPHIFIQLQMTGQNIYKQINYET